MRFWERPTKEFLRDMEFDENGKPITKMRIRIFLKRGKVCNYVVQLEHLIDVDWKQVVRFNYYHGFYHKDFYNLEGQQIKKVNLNEFSGIIEAVDFAVADISRRYKEYIRTFKEGGFE